jgi:hypothetical protein
VHPIEHLRMVARADDAGPSLLASEAAAALGGFASQPAAMVTACRRMVDRHVAVGPVWWLCARLLVAADPRGEALRIGSLLDADATASVLEAELPRSASVALVGWPEQVSQALRRRGDVEALVVDWEGEGSALARRLRGAGSDVSEVPAWGAGAAAVVADVVLLEAISAGPDGFLCAPGSRAAAAVGRHAGSAVWMVAGVGRVLPARLWGAQLARLDSSAVEPWDRGAEVVPADLIGVCIGADGSFDPSRLAERADCPAAPELLR